MDRFCRLIAMGAACAAWGGFASADEKAVPPAKAETHEKTEAEASGLRGKSDLFRARERAERDDLMQRLMELPENQLESQLAKWPRFEAMQEERREEFKKRVLNWRRRNVQIAEEAAKREGIVVTAARRDEFIREFWIARRRVDETVRRENEPLQRELEELALVELRERFGTVPPKVEPVSPNPALGTPKDE